MATAQSALWANNAGGEGNERGEDIIIDENGNVYTVGFFQGSADFDPGSGIEELVAENSTDVFIQKLDANGDFVWAKKIGGTAFDSPTGLEIDGEGNLYVCGFFSGTVDFDPNDGITEVASAGGSDGFLLKLDADGNFIRVKTIAGAGTGDISGMTIDADNNVYLVGSFDGTADFDPSESSEVNFTSVADEDLFVQKLDRDGNYMWAITAGGPSSDIALGIVPDANGNTYVTGYFYEMLSFGAGTVSLTSAGAADVFVFKLDGAGNVQWAKPMGGANFDFAFAIDSDDDANTYVTGSFKGEATFGTEVFSSNDGSDDIFVQKIDTDGNVVWAKPIGGMGMDQAHDLAVDPSGKLYLTGMFEETVDFDPNEGVEERTSTGSRDIFVLRLDTGGNYVWANTMGSASEDRGRGIAVSSEGTVSVTGSFNASVDFGINDEENILTSNGNRDFFVLTLNGFLTSTENAAYYELTVYPNPVQEFVVVTANTPIDALVLTNVVGQTILEAKVGSTSKELDLSQLIPGIYYLTISVDGKMSTTTIVKN
jgi:hypothetical protein